MKFDSTLVTVEEKEKEVKEAGRRSISGAETESRASAVL